MAYVKGLITVMKEMGVELQFHTLNYVTERFIPDMLKLVAGSYMKRVGGDIPYDAPLRGAYMKSLVNEEKREADDLKLFKNGV